MQNFVAKQNIQRFNEMLAGETDEERRALLKRMIADEEAKLGTRNGSPSAEADGEDA